MANRKWTQAERSTIVRMWRDGASLKEIAAELGESKDNIGAQMQYMRSLGVDLPYRKARVDVEALNNIG